MNSIEHFLISLTSNLQSSYYYLQSMKAAGKNPPEGIQLERLIRAIDEDCYVYFDRHLLNWYPHASL
jgi:hypothetical protein